MDFETNAKNYYAIFSIIFVIFIISSNIAWLNPRPGYEVYKIPKKIPFMWQYDRDAAVEIITSAYFPKAFRIERYKSRINRPVYPMVVWVTGTIIGFIAKPVVDLSPLERAGVAYVIVKFCLHLLAAILMFHLIREYFNAPVALTGVALLFFDSYIIRHIATFHTKELQFISPIIMLYLFNDLCKSYDHKKNIIYSIIIGILMLAKENYCIYLATLIFALLNRRVLEMIISIISHLIPLVLYLIFLKLYGLNYHNEEIDHGMGVWLLHEFIYKNPIEMLKIVTISFKKYCIILADKYFVWILFAIASVKTISSKMKHSQTIFQFLLLCMLTNWLQAFAARKYASFITLDISIFVFAFSSFFLCEMFQKYSPEIKNRIVGIIVITWLFVGILTLIHFPWVSPYDQPCAKVKNIQNDLDPTVKY